MDFERPRADPKLPPAFLVGGTSGDQGKHLSLARRQEVVA